MAKRRASTLGELRATCASAGLVVGDDGAPPRTVQLLRIGEMPARDGRRKYRIDGAAHAEQVIAATQQLLGNTDFMIDYDHQAVFGAKDGVGGQAKASGWIKPATLRIEDGGIVGDVDWTTAATQALADREYRYLSPYFGHDAGGRVTRIFNAALTNRPELELKAVASMSQDNPDGDTFMDEIAEALGLTAGATQEQIMQAIAALAGGATAARTERAAMCSALGLAEGASLDELRTAAALRVDPTGFVPRAEFDKLSSQLGGILEERVTASVDSAIAAGKIAPASRDWALGYARKDADGFAQFIGAAPVIVKAGEEARTAAAQEEGKLTDEQRAICSMLKIPEEKFLDIRKKETGK